mmetsp:Transcript_50259/g.92869  ORF Transcript_50259/g.92869 Transcript_50259/m.92869 type:complete len:312 (+) Transcript_50259:46-981(+)
MPMELALVELLKEQGVDEATFQLLDQRNICTLEQFAHCAGTAEEFKRQIPGLKPRLAFVRAKEEIDKKAAREPSDPPFRYSVSRSGCDIAWGLELTMNPNDDETVSTRVEKIHPSGCIANRNAELMAQYDESYLLQPGDMIQSVNGLRGSAMRDALRNATVLHISFCRRPEEQASTGVNPGLGISTGPSSGIGSIANGAMPSINTDSQAAAAVPMESSVKEVGPITATMAHAGGRFLAFKMDDIIHSDAGYLNVAVGTQVVLTPGTVQHGDGKDDDANLLYAYATEPSGGWVRIDLLTEEPSGSYRLAAHT